MPTSLPTTRYCNSSHQACVKIRELMGLDTASHLRQWTTNVFILYLERRLLVNLLPCCFPRSHTYQCRKDLLAYLPDDSKTKTTTIWQCRIIMPRLTIQHGTGNGYQYAGIVTMVVLCMYPQTKNCKQMAPTYTQGDLGKLAICNARLVQWMGWKQFFYYKQCPTLLLLSL
jgi:hypothetical protein